MSMSREDILAALETRERSAHWIYVACDRDEDGEIHLVNATGIYADELTAGLAGQSYVRDYLNDLEGVKPETHPIPLFIEHEPRPAEAMLQMALAALQTIQRADVGDAGAAYAAGIATGVLTQIEERQTATDG